MYYLMKLDGDVVAAKKLAGYGDNSSTTAIVEALKMKSLKKLGLTLPGLPPKAAVSLMGALQDPTQLGIKEKMIAAKDVLDRAGLGKVDKVDVNSGGGIFYLPPKEGTNE